MASSVTSSVWLLLVIVGAVYSAPQVEEMRAAHIDHLSYLQQYGYLENSTNGNYAAASVNTAVREFQRYNGLAVTGVVDQATQSLIAAPRCGVPDYSAGGPASYVTNSKWPIKTLTYKISQYTPDMVKANVDSEIARAFKAWSDVSGLKFTKLTSGTTNIDVKFVSGDHGDGYPFDGPSGVLAHAFYPTSGMTHFDDAETWTLYSSAGTNLFQVATHELGHALGLGHSNVAGSIMLPYYYGYNAKAKLGADDIAGIRSLYGSCG